MNECLMPRSFLLGGRGLAPETARISRLAQTSVITARDSAVSATLLQVATDLIEIDPENPGMRAIERAAAAVRRGEVVAIPTDALYTLVADPLNLHAVGRVFAAKGREKERSLPLLVSDLVMAEELAKEVSARFYLLARRFWPGALTIIAPASSRVPLKVTGNTGRLALRQSKSKWPMPCSNVSRS